MLVTKILLTLLFVGALWMCVLQLRYWWDVIHAAYVKWTIDREWKGKR